jgi:hypothetical protein
VATEAENKPVCGVPVYARKGMDINTGTHEYEDPIGVFLPAVGHLVVFFLCR